MRKTTTRIKIGEFDALEDRVVLSAATASAQNEAIVKDVTSFYSNLVSTTPALSQAYTSAAAGSTARTTAQTNLTNALTTDINNLATQLLTDLGAGAASAIRTSITGGVGGGTTVTNTTGTASAGSLLDALLAITSAEPGIMATSEGINLATDLSIAAATALTAGKPSFPASNFGSFTQTYFNAVSTPAAQLKTDQAAASDPPTTAQQTAITNDIAAIDTTTVSNVNTLATDLLTTMGTGSTAAIQQVVTGVPSTQTGVTFTSSSSSSMATYGSLLATIQAIESDPTLLTDADVIAAITSLYAFS